MKQVEAYTVGTIERIEHLSTHNNLYRVSIAYPNNTAGNELPQFLNVVFGNTSLKQGISVENVTLSHHLMENHSMFPGPRFGIQGLRDLLGVPQAPLLCTALKPMGCSSQEFADMAYSLAKGGIDIIKDDHGLSNQVWSPFEERVQLCSAAVQRANQETGRNCLYAPCLNAPSDLIFNRAWYAKECGAGAVMILPGLSGWDVVRKLSCDSTFGLPILIHPAMLGGWLHSHPNRGSEEHDEEEHPHGLSHEFLFGILPRLCGGDGEYIFFIIIIVLLPLNALHSTHFVHLLFLHITSILVAVIFANAGGRFQFTNEECQKIAEGCRRPFGRFDPVLPSPAGGMKLHRIQEMRATFGDDTLFLIGGALLEQGPDLEEDAKLFAHCAGRDNPYSVAGGVEKNIGDKTMTVPPLIDKDGDSSTFIAEVEQVAIAVRRRVLEYTLKNNGYVLYMHMCFAFVDLYHNLLTFTYTEDIYHRHALVLKPWPLYI